MKDYEDLKYKECVWQFSFDQHEGGILRMQTFCGVTIKKPDFEKIPLHLDILCGFCRNRLYMEWNACVWFIQKQPELTKGKCFTQCGESFDVEEEKMERSLESTCQHCGKNRVVLFP